MLTKTEIGFMRWSRKEPPMNTVSPLSKQEIEEIRKLCGDGNTHPLDSALGDIHEAALTLHVAGDTVIAQKLAKAHETIQKWAVAISLDELRATIDEQERELALHRTLYGYVKRGLYKSKEKEWYLTTDEREIDDIGEAFSAIESMELQANRPASSDAEGKGDAE